MAKWKELMNEAMQLEEADTISAHAKFAECTQVALAEAQSALDADVTIGMTMEVVYGALAAYTQQVMMRMRAEDPEPGGVDHAFRAGQVYGVSCVLNHLFDSLRDPNGSDLAVLDEFSDQMHDEILQVCNEIDLSIELLDAKGEYWGD
ncbi:MAG: hypothetical protein VX320_05960 [Candidatus Thermoplasmatota archaeon]|nr:hypothetical protein [Candidatus Thermoplasmatota archaeon]